MGERFMVDPGAVYDDGALVLGLKLTFRALARARRAGELRFTRKGKRTLYRGQWVIDWLEHDNSRPSVPVVKGVQR